MPPNNNRLSWPKGTIFLFFVVVAASFLTWGTIESDYSGQSHLYQANMYTYGPTPPNFIDGSEDIPRSGTLWQSGLIFHKWKIHGWSLVVAMGFILGIEVLVQRFGKMKLRGVAYVFDAYGLIIASTSLFSFLYQGGPGMGLFWILHVFIFMGLFHYWQHNREE
jgi:hypothetical protein